MPEIKHNFTGGKMNKDLDERIVPNGEYRHAMNIQVGTTDNSDVGVVQNILGNVEIPCGSFAGGTTVGSVSHPSEDSFYWFVKSKKFEEYKHVVDGDSPPWPDLTFIIGHNGDAELAEGTDYSTNGYNFIETTWNWGLFPSSTILVKPGDDSVKAVVISHNVIFKMWDSVLKKNHYELAAGIVTTTSYDPNDTISINVGGGLSSWVVNYSYPFDIAPWNGSDGFINGWGDVNNANVIEISDARGISVGMTVKGWGVDQVNNKIKNYLPDNVKVLRVDYSSWGHNNNLIQSGGGDKPRLAKIYLSKNVYNTPDAGTNNEYITHLEFVDNILGFQEVDFINGINILDNNIYWSDGKSIPKSINIEDGIIGSSDGNGTPIWSEITKLVADKQKVVPLIDLTEQHLAVAKPAPNHAPTVNLIPAVNVLYKFSKFTLDVVFRSSVAGLVNLTRNYQLEEVLTISLALIEGSGGPIYAPGTILFASRKSEIPYGETIEYPSFIFEIVKDLGPGGIGRTYQIILRKVPDTSVAGDDYSVMQKDAEPILKEDIGRFAIRYRYKHNQYSTIGPWSEPAFLPQKYDIDSEEGINTGMQNSIRQVILSSLIPPNLRKDIVGLDVLYKDSSSPSVYKIDYIDKNNTAWSNQHYTTGVALFNYLKQNNQGELIKEGSNLYNNWVGRYTINGKIKKSIIPELQTLRPWDNVPKKALAQEIVGNRIIYGNYTQGNNLLDTNGSKITTELEVNLQTYRLDVLFGGGYSGGSEIPYKSIKSFRNYQVGVVYSDIYGRSTPVLTTQDSHIFVDITHAAEFNELNVSLKSDIPSWVDSYRFYIKGGEEEYYNLVQKNVYLSTQKDTWIAFDSKDRNKVTEEDTITLKVGGITNYDIGRINSYNILSIENEAPESIKYTRIRRYYKIGSGDSTKNDLKNLSVGNANIRLNRHTGNMPVTGGGSYALPGDMNSGITKCDSIRFTLKSLSDTNVLHPFDHLKITNIESIVETGSDEPRWEITLEEPLPESHADVIAALAHDSSNIIIEMFEDRKEDSVDFEGRFFVKIGADQDFALALGGATTTNEYGVTDNLPVFYYKDSALTADDSKYSPTLEATTYAFTDTVTFTRPFNDTQEKWGQFLINPNPVSNVSSGNITENPTILENYGMRGDDYPLYDTPISGYKFLNFPSVTVPTESVGRSLGSAYEGTWFIDEGDFVGRVQFETFSFSDPQNGFSKDISTEIDGYDFLLQGGIQWGNVNGTSGSNTGITNNTISLSLGGSHASYLTEPYTQVFGPWEITKRITPGWENNIREPLVEGGEFPSVAAAVTRLTVGNRLRWLEDPSSTIYTIKDVNKKTRINYTLDDKLGSVTINGTETNGNFPAYFKYPHNFRQNWNMTLDKPMASWSPVNASPGSAISNGQTVAVTIASVPQALTGSPDGAHFFLEDAGENAGKLHPGMVLTHYPDAGTDITSQNIRIHSIVHSDLDDKPTVRMIKPSGGFMSTIAVSDILTFAQYSMDGASAVMAARGAEIISTSAQYVNNGTFDSNWDFDNEDAVKKAIGYTLQILKPATETFQQINQTFSAYNVWETSPRELPEVDLYTEVSETYYTSSTSNLLENIIPIGANVYLDTHIVSGLNVSKLDNNFAGTIEFDVEVDDLSTGRSNYSLPVLTDSVTVDDQYNVFDGNASPSILAADTNKVQFSIPFTAIASSTGVFDRKVRLFSSYGLKGGYTKIKNVLGETIELINANNSKTNGTAGQLVLKKSNPGTINGTPDILKVVYENKTIFLEVVEDVIDSNFVKVRLAKNDVSFNLRHFNCYSFGTGVESVSIGDEFNKQRLLNNGRISSTIDWEFEEEDITNGLIYSGIYNPASGLNNLNQFIQADKITKEVNPTYGSIQRLFTRDSDLVTFCEDKVLRILANKDALFNADGNTNLTASTNVLGQAIPFAGDYGISKNPESLASESYRLYFADKQRGAVLRLSMDGLTPISNHGMGSWFKDNLKLSGNIIGSYDDNKDEYNITLKKEIISDTISFSEKVKGWVSFKSFIPENGVSLSNNYYTFDKGKPYIHHQKGTAQNPVDYNTFYNIPKDSEIEVILNDGPSIVKSFYTLSYEGSQSKINKFVQAYDDSPWAPSSSAVFANYYHDNEYYNLIGKPGWYIDSIKTDMDEGSVDEFIEKEGKWFNYIKGKQITTIV